MSFLDKIDTGKTAAISPLTGGAPPPPSVPSNAASRLRSLGSTAGFTNPALAAALDNDIARRTAAVAPTSTTANQPTGAVGASGLGVGNAVPVGTLAAWQFNNSGLDAALRIAAPVGGIFLFYKGHHVAGGALIAAAGVLWANRLTGINL